MSKPFSKNALFHITPESTEGYELYVVLKIIITHLELGDKKKARACEGQFYLFRIYLSVILDLNYIQNYVRTAIYGSCFQNNVKPKILIFFHINNKWSMFILILKGRVGKKFLCFLPHGIKEVYAWW